jgi:hypothetical protein
MEWRKCSAATAHPPLSPLAWLKSAIVLVAYMLAVSEV